jgi:predicted O-linked N-acetylglucosamine transferase (SPINDLY family)/glycosyltransferase involved in cell wall biosynthesis
MSTALQQASSGAMTIVELFNEATALSEGGKRDDAITLYRTWLAATPSPIAFAAWFNLGVLLSDTGDTGGAEAAYRMAIAVNPKFCEAYLNLGTLLERLKRPAESLETWRQVLGFASPDVPAERAHYISAVNNLGRLLEIQKDYPAAEDMLARSLRIDPKQPNVITHWVHLRQKQCKWPVYAAGDIGISEQELMEATSALAMLGASGDPAWQLKAARNFVQQKVIKDAPRLSGPTGYGHERLRIGYLSSDFCSHAVSILTAELYGLHDRSRVEVYGFDWSNEDGSPLRARVVGGFDHHVRIHTLTDEDAARLIRAHEIDILVDLHGLTSGARPNILAYRPAPVQVTWLGLPGPTGQDGIDYVISDPFVLPPELEPFFTEKPLHMPRCFQINDRARPIGTMPTREACGLPETAFVYCAFNNSFKVTPEVFDTWMRILHRVPDSVLWVVGDNEQVRTNLARRAELAGIAPARVVFANRVPPHEYLARFQVADLSLDTMPFGGGTTASDALWAGLPILTCAGRTFSSRMAGSLLQAVDMPELITYDLAAYEEKAVQLGLDRAYAAGLKERLRANRDTCALFDSPRFVRDLEDKFEQIAIRGTRSGAKRAPRGKPDSKLPLVSILIPTHNRPDYAELALKCALGQTWENTEIIISDNSTDELTRERFAPYVEQNPNIVYLRAPGLPPLQNFLNCFENSQGEFVNYLMDDDLWHPQKIERMMSFMLVQPTIGLVTSFRQLIDGDGNYMAQIPGTERLFDTETLIGGRSLGEMILTNGQNMVGEPTTALWRRSAIGEKFGMFMGRQYDTLSDVATWLQILSSHDCVYLPEALSYFRIHGGQDQARGLTIRVRSNIDWLQLLCDAHEHGAFMRNRSTIKEMLTSKVTTCIWYLSSVSDDLKPDTFQLPYLQSVVQQALGILLKK